MNATFAGARPVRLALLWIARVTGVLAIVPLMLIVFGENGSGPAGWQQWVYLALFPFGFSAGYLLGWKWPVAGGTLALACMVASQFVLWQLFPASAYLIWGVLCLPGVFYVVAGWDRGFAPKPVLSTSP